MNTALGLGVRGFIPKTLAGRSIVSALRLVASGEIYAPADFLREGGHAADGGALTPRERDVLTQLRQGASNKDMARILGIAETTVKLHLRSLGEKVGARSRLEIQIKAMERQWI